MVKKGDMVLVMLATDNMTQRQSLAEVLEVYPVLPPLMPLREMAGIRKNDRAIWVYIFDTKSEIATLESEVTAISDGEVVIHRLEGGR